VKQALIDAMDGYHAVHDIKGMMEVEYLAARLHNSDGDIVLRDRAAERFVQLSSLCQLSKCHGGRTMKNESRADATAVDVGTVGDVLSLPSLQHLLVEWSK
jgi:hypothetical protein